MIGETTIEVEGDEVTKTHTDPSKWENEVKFIDLVHRTIAPRLLGTNRNTLSMVMRRIPSALHWFSKEPSDEDIRDVGMRLLKKINCLHDDYLICHRDIHIRNVLIDEDNEPYIIDWEYAVNVDPHGPCYDLIGPQSKIPKPKPHRIRSTTETGVWWDTPMTSVSPVAQYFGPLKEYQ